MDSTIRLLWHGLSYTRDLVLIPGHSIIKHSPPQKHPHPLLLCYRNTEVLRSYIKVKVMKAAAARSETRRHVPLKRMNLCQLKSVQEGGSCALMCVCVHPHDNKDESTHFLAQWAHIRGPLGRAQLNNTFNVIAQWLVFVSGPARCDPHKNSKAKWIRI